MNLMRAVQNYTLFSVSQDITLTPKGVISYNWTVPNFSESVQGLALFSPPLLLRQDEASMSIMLTKGLPGAGGHLSAFVKLSGNTPIRCHFR